MQNSTSLYRLSRKFGYLPAKNVFNVAAIYTKLDIYHLVNNRTHKDTALKRKNEVKFTNGDYITLLHNLRENTISNDEEIKTRIFLILKEIYFTVLCISQYFNIKISLIFLNYLLYTYT